MTEPGTLEVEDFDAQAERLMTYCDACGIGTTARMYVVTPAGGVLKFCFHHANRHSGKLRADGAFIYSLSEEEG